MRRDRRAAVWAACLGGAALAGGLALADPGEAPPSVYPSYPAHLPERPQVFPGYAPALSPTPRIAGGWRVLPLPDAPLEGSIVFYDRQFEGGAGCGRISGAYDRMDPWFRARDLHLEGRCELEAELLERLRNVVRLTRRGSVVELSDGAGRVLLRLSPF